MKIVIFGLTVSSSWGNGHATLWRGLIKAMTKRGHEVTFFEKDVPYYATHRDLWELPNARLNFYSSWSDALPAISEELDSADIAIVTSYCPDARLACPEVFDSKSMTVFYDMDTPITLDHLRAGKPVEYIPKNGLRDFDLVLSYTGGLALQELKSRLSAKKVAPLYGSVDPDVHFPVDKVPLFEASLSYLGTYAEDRQPVLDALFIEPAKHLRDKRFLIGGAMYPEGFPWSENIYFVKHVAPTDHPAFYSSSDMTLNVTRKAMAEMGFCPSGRLFEAAACGTPILTDWWEGLDDFYTPGDQILIARNADDAIEAIQRPQRELWQMAERARERTLEEHTADKRVLDFEKAISDLTGAREPVGVRA